MFRAALIFLLLGGHAFGDDLLRAAQRELRARKLYFGPIDGRESAASTAAIQRFKSLKGIDNTAGQLDGDTLRALGITTTASDPLAEEGCTKVQQYLAARTGDDIDREMGFFADKIDYFDDGLVERAFVRTAHLRENKRWPQRRSTLLDRIATADFPRTGEVTVTARIRTEVTDSAGQRRAGTEDWTFILRKMRDDLRIISLKLTPPKRTG